LLGDEASRSAIEFYETSVLPLARAGWSRSAIPGAGGAPPIGTRKLNTQHTGQTNQHRKS
jgi:hypothetical protein